MAQSDKMVPFTAANVDAGYDTFNLQIRDQYALTEGSSNVSSGQAKGLGPRYGMAPLPGHSDTETLGSTRLPGLMASESTGLTAKRDMMNRKKIFGVVPVTLGTWDNITLKKLHYAWLIGYYSAADTAYYLDLKLGSADTGLKMKFRADTPIIKYIPDVAAGLGAPEITTNLNATERSQPIFNNVESPTVTGSFKELVTITAGTNYVGFSVLSVSGIDVATKWLIASAGAAPSVGTKPYSCAFTWDAIWFYLSGGQPSCFNTRNFSKTLSNPTFYMLDGAMTGGEYFLYRTDHVDQVAKTIYSAVFNQGAINEYNVVNANLSAGTRVDRLDAAIVTDTDTQLVLLYDEKLTTNTSFNAIFMAAKKAVMAIYQDWNRSGNGSPLQWFDLTQMLYAPTDFTTTGANTGGADLYTENAISKKTCWQCWPAYVDGTPLNTTADGTTRDGILHFTLGAAGSGILRKETVYEFAYSIYSKQFNFETNVGTPAKIRTGTNDFVALSIYRDDQNATPVCLQFAPVTLGSDLAGPFRTQKSVASQYLDVNNLEYRMYYRALGEVEWKPALFIDAAKFWFYPDHNILWTCTGEQAGLPGGRPAGFTDYSPLPKDEYDDVVTYDNRVFWTSKKNMIFSPRNNPFVYPGRNAFPIPQGEFRGCLLHTFPGETEQGSRLLIYGSKVMYVGRFTGQMSQAAVQVSFDTVGTFDVDGSDFLLEEWSTNVAFSKRSAVIADGVHFYWGPQGVFKDNGIDVPSEISVNITPELHELYDANRTDEIHCIYNDQAKEIVWFYPPRTADANFPTHTLTLNVVTLEFYPGKCAGKVDAAQKLNIENGDSLSAISGDRGLVISRANEEAVIQRAQFFDYRNLCGDIYPGKELMVKSWTSPTTSTRDFVLATGFDSAVLASIAVGDLVGTRNVKGYSEKDAQDFIGIVTARDSNSITVAVPPGVTFPAAETLAFENYFQLYFPDIHGIPWVAESNYWAPGGLLEKWFWRYIYMTMRLDPLLPSEGRQTITAEHKTPQCQDFSSKDLVITDNSDGHCQIYYQTDWEKHAGQALKIRLSGTQFAGHWVLQYLAMFGTNRTFDFLKEFEQ